MQSATSNVDIVRNLEVSLRAETSLPLPRAILDVRPLDEHEAKEVIETLRLLLVHTTVLRRFDSGSEFHFKDVDQLLREAVQIPCHDRVIEALNYLRLYQALAKQIRPLIENTYEVWYGNRSLVNSAAKFIHAIEDLDDFDPTLLSSRIVLGKLHALHDRHEANQLFTRAKAGFEDPIHLFLGEIGVRTYFSQAELELNRKLIAHRRETLPSRQQHRMMEVASAKFLVLMSCNEKFLQIYLPYWLLAAEYLNSRGFAYHFIVTAESADEAARLVDNAETVRRALATFRGYLPTTFARNVSFSWAAVPSWCPDARTFSACARFLYMREISEETGMQVIPQDIDFELAADPSPWFNALPKTQISMTSSRVAISIDPWQKFRGGALALPPLSQAQTWARCLEDYLLLGLADNYAWFLDQNALAFLYEQISLTDGLEDGILFSLAALGPLIRPSNGVKIHALWEEEHNPAGLHPPRNR